jgi:MinD-like ATPase involved in chromosome partitioning or flagellar assembly
MGRTFVFHSYKGGTGKTTIATNVAAIYAQQGKRVCLLDFDFRAPSLYFLLRTKPETNRWLNDLLNIRKRSSKCAVADALHTVKLGERGKLAVGFADPSSEAMWDSTEKWSANTFRRLLDAKIEIFRDLGFDYLIIDTSPGIQDSSMNALAASDLVVLVLKHDELDAEGTRELVKDFHKKLGCQTAMILNRVLSKPYEQLTAEDENRLSRKVQKEFGFPVLGVIACFCDVLIEGNRTLYSVEKPKHPFVEKLSEIASKMLSAKK